MTLIAWMAFMLAIVIVILAALALPCFWAYMLGFMVAYFFRELLHWSHDD